MWQHKIQTSIIINIILMNNMNITTSLSPNIATKLKSLI